MKHDDYEIKNAEILKCSSGEACSEGLADGCEGELCKIGRDCGIESGFCIGNIESDKFAENSEDPGSKDTD